GRGPTSPGDALARDGRLEPAHRVRTVDARACPKPGGFTRRIPQAASYAFWLARVDSCGARPRAGAVAAPGPHVGRAAPGLDRVSPQPPPGCHAGNLRRSDDRGSASSVD